MIDDLPQPSPSPVVTIIAVLVVVAAIIGGLLLLQQTQPQPVQIVINPPVPTATPAPTNTPNPIEVYVTGAVAEPESVVTLPRDSRVEAAIAAAGGVTADADLTRVNLADRLHDGAQIHVPFAATAGPEPVATLTEVALPTPVGGAVVYINTATLPELTELPGVGETLAQRIIDFREANGPFMSLDDLDQVNGIGPSLLGDLEGLISFE